MTQAVRYTVRCIGLPDPDDGAGDEKTDAMLTEIQAAIEKLPYYESSELEDFEDE